MEPLFSPVEQARGHNGKMYAVTQVGVWVPHAYAPDEAIGQGMVISVVNGKLAANYIDLSVDDLSFDWYMVERLVGTPAQLCKFSTNTNRYHLEAT